MDETLDRSVRVSVLDPTLPHTADVLDAARRVTLARDPRLVRVLDVGHDGDLPFVVMEGLPGRTLTQAVTGAPLQADEARRLVGEVAQALSGAADRGLHHQRLTPDCLVVDGDGSVKLTGTATEAAATGADARDGGLASRVDALGLISVLYAALTGRWPGTTPSGLPDAPRVGGHPVPPADLVAGVPNDLNQLCTAALGTEDDVPAGPADVARLLAPWPQPQPLTDPCGLLLPGTVDATTAAPATPTHPAPATPTHPAPGTEPTPPATAVTVTDDRSSAPAAAASAPSTSPARASARFSAPVTTAERGRDDPAAVPPGSFRGWDDLSTIGIPVVDEDEEPLVPFISAVAPQQRLGEQSRLVIGMVVGFVLLVVVIATLSLRSLKAPTGLIPDDPGRPIVTSTPTSPGTRAATPDATAATAQVVSPTAGPQIAGVQAIDPEGDGSENDGQATRAIDGDPSTIWRSSRYNSADFGGLKDGLGLVVDLGAGGSTLVQQVVIDVAGDDGTVELRASLGPGLEGSTVVARATIHNGRAVLTPTQPVNSRLLLLWFTTLPQTDGKYQLLVSEINVR